MKALKDRAVKGLRLAELVDKRPSTSLLRKPSRHCTLLLLLKIQLSMEWVWPAAWVVLQARAELTVRWTEWTEQTLAKMAVLVTFAWTVTALVSL